jgi:hypothetical protein
MRIGYIGLGKMGLPMATNLRAAGHDLIVHNRSRGKVDDFVADGPVGARVALEGLDDQGGHALFEALGDEAAGDADGEVATLGGEAYGVFEPGVEVMAGYLKLEAAEDGTCPPLPSELYAAAQDDPHEKIHPEEASE